MRPQPLNKAFPLALALAVGVCCASCRVSTEDLDTWKGTVKGPGKILAVMLADKYEIGLRQHAAWTLIDMERQDVDGLTELQRAIQKLDERTRKQIIEGLLPLLETRLKEKADPEEEDPSMGAPPYQVRAKDAAFMLAGFAGVEARARLTQAMVQWYVEDFERRSLSGSFSAEQVVRGLGAPAAGVLVGALSTKLPQQALIKLSELIGQLGDPATKKKAAQRLVQIEREMEGEGFRKWLREGITEQLSTSGAKPDEVRVLRAIEANQHKFTIEGALPAMKYLADQQEITERLVGIASTKTVDKAMVEKRVNAVPGLDSKAKKTLVGEIASLAAKQLNERRVAALQALEGNVSKKHLKPLLDLALDTNSPTSVRDYAFDRVGDIRSPEAIPPMWDLVQDEKKNRLRWRAGELVLAIGGNKVLKEFFNRLPSGKEVTYEPEELEGYASRMSQMNPLPREVAKSQLNSPNWWNRVIAVKFLERRGTKQDISLLQRLQDDDREVKGKGWAKGETVGKVAKSALAALQKSLKQASGTQADGAPGQK
jgi:hypothetical protein